MRDTTGTVTLTPKAFVDLAMPKPNPDDWTDTAGAALILNRSRPTVYDLVDREILKRYRIGTHAMFWVPEVREVATALERLRRG